jgi:hypothetical protein
MVEALAHLRLDPIESLVDAVESLVDSVEALVDLAAEVIETPLKLGFGH